MKKLLGVFLWLLAVPTWAQFTPGQVLTAAQLNTQFSLMMPKAGGTFSGTVTTANLVAQGTLSGTGVTTLLGPYLTSATAAATYLTISNASATYLTQSAAAATYLTISNAASIYLTQSSAASTYAPIASPTFTGTPAAPTAATATNTTQLATTAYVVAKLATPTPIGSTTANTGAFTTLSASSTVSGTGFSTYLASPPAIGGTAPAAGAFTTLSSTGNFTPSQTNGIVGTTTNNNANAGSVGEFICAQVTNGGSPTGCATNVSTPVALTTATPANVTSISLTAGDWDVQGWIGFIGGATTTVTFAGSSVSTTSATVGLQAISFTNGVAVFGSVGIIGLTAPKLRVSAASTITVYLVTNQSFGTSTMSATGFIGARRVR